MASLNKAFILGNLGQDPELRYTPTQHPVTTLSIATTESRPTKDGQRQEQTEWHRVIVWGKQAENCHKYLKKGRPVFVEGRIQTRSWDDKNGVKRYSTEIIATSVQFMPHGQSNSDRGYNQDHGSQGMSDMGGMSGGRDAYSGPSFPPAEGSSSFPSFGGGDDFGEIPF